MTSGTSNKYITTQALDWLNAAWSRLFSWVIDEEHGNQRPSIIGSFIFGAVVMRIVPSAFHYAGLAVGALIILAFVVGCLVPVALLVEWVLRKAFGRSA